MKNLTLIVDIGNTTTIFGVFDDEKFLGKLTTYTHETPNEEKGILLKKFLTDSNFEISKGLVFSVVPTKENQITKVIKNVTNLDIKIFENNDVKLFKVDVDNPNEIGADLLGDLVGANSLYGYPNLVVDLGTVTKILYTNKDGVFEGCSFVPGLQTSLSLFNEKTALLPEISEFRKSPKELGKNTKDAMNHGVYWSVVSFINKEKEQFPNNVKLILTGGNCTVIADDIGEKIVDQDLTLKGMNIIFREIEK